MRRLLPLQTLGRVVLMAMRMIRLDGIAHGSGSTARRVRISLIAALTAGFVVQLVSDCFAREIPAALTRLSKERALPPSLGSQFRKERKDSSPYRGLMMADA